MPNKIFNIFSNDTFDQAGTYFDAFSKDDQREYYWNKTLKRKVYNLYLLPWRGNDKKTLNDWEQLINSKYPDKLIDTLNIIHNDYPEKKFLDDTTVEYITAILNFYRYVMQQESYQVYGNKCKTIREVERFVGFTIADLLHDMIQSWNEEYTKELDSAGRPYKKTECYNYHITSAIWGMIQYNDYLEDLFNKWKKETGFFKKMKLEESLNFEEGNYFDTFSKEQTAEKQIYEAKQTALNLFEEYLNNHQHWNDEITMEKLFPGNSDSLSKEIMIKIGVYDHVNRILNFLKNECLSLNLIDDVHLKEILDTYNYLCKTGAWIRLFGFSNILSRVMVKISYYGEKDEDRLTETWDQLLAIIPGWLGKRIRFTTEKNLTESLDYSEEGNYFDTFSKDNAKEQVKQSIIEDLEKLLKEYNILNTDSTGIAIINDVFSYHKESSTDPVKFMNTVIDILKRLYYFDNKTGWLDTELMTEIITINDLYSKPSLYPVNSDIARDGMWTLMKHPYESEFIEKTIIESLCVELLYQNRYKTIMAPDVFFKGQKKESPYIKWREDPKERKQFILNSLEKLKDDIYIHYYKDPTHSGRIENEPEWYIAMCRAEYEKNRLNLLVNAGDFND